MSRSVDIAPLGDAWLAGDPLLTRLRGARPEIPEDLASPHSPANRAMLQRIIGGSVAADEPSADRWAPRPVRRALLRATAVAAVAAIVAGLVVVSPFGSTEPTAAAVVREAAAASQEALDSGRAVLTVELLGIRDSYEYAFAGDDVGVTTVLGSPGRAPSSAESRIVDGEMYWHVGDDPEAPWFHYTGGIAVSDFGADPRSLLATLEPTAGFEIVGDDTVDGVAVTRLRATTPETIDAYGLSLGNATGVVRTAARSGTSVVDHGPATFTVTDLDVWIDSENVVRRIDLTMSPTYDGIVAEVPPGQPDDVTTASVRFTDIGVPNTIEVPPNVRDVSPDELANPAPPSG